MSQGFVHFSLQMRPLFFGSPSFLSDFHCRGHNIVTALPGITFIFHEDEEVMRENKRYMPSESPSFNCENSRFLGNQTPTSHWPVDVD